MKKNIIPSKMLSLWLSVVIASCGVAPQSTVFANVNGEDKDTTEDSYTSSSDNIYIENEDISDFEQYQGEIFSDTLDANSKVRTVSLQQSNSNFIQNGSYEDLANFKKVYIKDNNWVKNWNCYQFDTSKYPNPDAYFEIINDKNLPDGTKAIKFTSNDNILRFSTGQEVSGLDTNKRYKITFKYKFEEGSEALKGLSIRITNKDANGTQFNSTPTINISDEFLEYSYSFNPLSKTVTAAIFFEKMTGSVIIDDVKITEDKTLYLDEKNITLNLDDTYTVVPKFYDGSNAQNVKFTSSDSSVAHVDTTTGEITPQKSGQATITCTYNNGNTIETTSLTVCIVDEKIKHVYDNVKQNWIQRLTGNDICKISDKNYANKVNSITNTAKKYQNSMKNITKDGDILWDDIKNDNIDVYYNNAFERVEAMALAYATKESPLYKNADLKNDIEMALNHFYNSFYNEKVVPQNKGEIIGNWWNWYIGIPQSLCFTLLLMGDDLSQDLINKEKITLENFNNDVYTIYYNSGLSGRMYSANLADTTLISVLRGILTYDTSLINSAIKPLQEILEYVESGDGIYPDGSFIQHSYYAYAAGYGATLLKSVENLVYTLSFITYDEQGKEVIILNKVENINNIYKQILESFKPLFAYGGMIDITRGRGISRSSTTDQNVTRGIIYPVAVLSEVAPENYKEQLRAFLKQQLLEEIDYNSKYLDSADIIQRKILEDILNDETIKINDKDVYTKVYGVMDKVVHSTDKYSLGISMFSNTTGSYEYMNNENKRGYHFSDGAIFLYTGDKSQYENYYPTVDWLRVAGTTTDGTKVNLTGTAKTLGQNSFVGGSSVGNYSTVAMDFKGLDTTLQAKKSWFLFDDEVVCLGAGINSKETNKYTETIVENRKINTLANKLVVNGKTVEKNSEKIQNAKWAYLQGNANDSIGYYFPQSNTTIDVLKESRTGDWADIGTSPTKKVTEEYASISIGHGAGAISNKTYSYVVLPNMSQQEVKAYSENPNIKVLTNTSSAQAVKNTKLNVTGINFWKAGAKVQKFTAQTPASLTIKQTGNCLEMGIADPSKNNGTTIIELEKDPNNPIVKIEKTAGVFVREEANKYIISVYTQNDFEKTHNLKIYFKK